LKEKRGNLKKKKEPFSVQEKKMKLNQKNLDRLEKKEKKKNSD
jgi:hypothetical protein